MAISRYRIVERNQGLWRKLLRLEESGLTVRQIAKFARIAYHRAERALKSPHYQHWKADKLANRVSAFDRAFAKDTEQMKAELASLIPLAIHTYEEAMKAGLENKALLNVATKAADSVLDRDERFNKTQNIAVTHELIPAAQLERARALAQELRKQTIDVTPARILELPASIEEQKS